MPKPISVLGRPDWSWENVDNPRALSELIFTEADNVADLHNQVRDAVHCHFEQENAPKIIRLHFVQEEAIAVSDSPAISPAGI